MSVRRPTPTPGRTREAAPGPLGWPRVRRAECGPGGRRRAGRGGTVGRTSPDSTGTRPDSGWGASGGNRSNRSRRPNRPSRIRIGSPRCLLPPSHTTTGRRPLLPVPPLREQLRATAAQRPGAADERGQEHPALVDPRQLGLPPADAFSIRCHAPARHPAMTAKSRSRGTRSGFCGVYPRARRQWHRSFGWKGTPNGSVITAANRPAVHSAVANPNAVGGSSNRRATTFPRARVSLAGRPGTGAPPTRRPPRVGRRDGPPPDGALGHAEEVGDLVGRMTVGVTGHRQTAAAF